MIDENFQAFRQRLADLVKGVEDYDLKIDQGADKIPAMTAPGVLFVVSPEERMVGQRLMAGGGAYGGPKALMCRAASFEVHIWGETRTQTEELISHVANAIHVAGWGSYELKGGMWEGEDGSVNNRGAYYVLHGEMIIPITRPAQSMVIGTEEAPLQFPTTAELAH